MFHFVVINIVERRELFLKAQHFFLCRFLAFPSSLFGLSDPFVGPLIQALNSTRNSTKSKTTATMLPATMPATAAGERDMAAG